MKPHVLTGGPSVGKTTVIEILAARGYAIAPEAARMVIEEQKLKDSDVLPWKNLLKFQEKVAKRQLMTEKEIKKHPTFLDRGLIDGYAYCIIGKVQPPPDIMKYGRHRYAKVFLLAPTGIHTTDDARIEDESLALQIHDEIGKAYKLFGYDPIPVPLLEPDERANYILSHI